MPSQTPNPGSNLIRCFISLIWANLLTGALLGSEPTAVSVEAPGPPRPGSALFTNGALVRLAIELSPANLDSLRQEPRRKVAAIVKEGSQVYHDVAVHLKGALGSFREVDDKPGLILNFQLFTPGQKFHGLRKIMLNNSVQDPTYLNEKLAGDLFRAANVPAPRTSHALVELNGRKLGLYVLKEGFSKDFLRLYFERTDGNFYDINQGFYDLGPGGDLQTRFRLDSGKESTPPLSDLAALIEACRENDPVRRWEKLQTVLDLNRFISYMAMEIITCHVDGYSVYGHNFRIYHDPANHKLVFIPNDMDRMFQEGRPFLQPGFTAQVATAVFRTPQGQQQYAARCAWLCTNVFNLGKLTNQVSEVAAQLRPALEAWQPPAAKQFDIQASQVCERLRRQATAIDRELNPGPATHQIK